MMRCLRSRLVRALAALALTALLANALPADRPARGLWLLPRKDSCNTAGCDLPGDMKTAPREVWSYGNAPDTYSFIRPVRTGKKQAFFAQVRGGLRLVRANGGVIWKRPTMGVSSVVRVLDKGDGRPLALVTLGTDRFCLIDVATGKTLWKWTMPAGSYLGGYQVLAEPGSTRLIVFPQNTMLGLCFEISAHPRLLWEHNYTGKYWQNFGPFFVLADMDNDGTREIVLTGKPGYAGVIDLTTGVVKFDLQYEAAGGDHAGRPYGVLTATDVDADGFRDIVMASCQVEEYISVLRNNAGRSLGLVWSKWVGADYPVETVKLRPNTTSVADVNGDGTKEIVVGLFNESGDGRWHTVIVEAMKGFAARTADLPDRYFWGCHDLDGDTRPEIITSKETSALVSTPTNLQAVDGRTGKDIVSVDGITPAAVSVKPPLDTLCRANVIALPYLQSRALLVSKAGQDYLWRIVNGRSVLSSLTISPISRTVISSDGTGTLGRLDLAIRSAQKDGIQASGPLVAEAGGKRELILSRSDGTIIGGAPDFAKSGAFKSRWTVQGAMPSAWIGPKGNRVLCAADPKTNWVSTYEPLPGEAKTVPIRRFATPIPINRGAGSRSTAGLLPFGSDEMRLFVGLRPGVHAMASACYNAAGTEMWLDKQNGPYPRIAAAADLNGDGREEIVVDNHGRHTIYDPKGDGKTIAVGWSSEIPGRGDGAKYAVPIVGPFGPKGATRIVMSGGLDALESLDSSGARVAKCDFSSTYIFQWCGAAVGRIRRTGEWDVGTVNNDGVFYCSDANTCRTRWTLALGAKADFALNVAAGDVDGDGRDNFVVGLPDGRLVALDEKNDKGSILWKVRFDAGVKEAIMADVDGDGNAEIIIELDDGRVKVLKGRK